MPLYESEEYNVFTHHPTYYAIAHKHYLQVTQLVSERDSIKQAKTDRDVDFICLKNALIGRNTMVVIVFSALCLEAFINHYGLSHYSDSFFKKHLDKLSPLSKWVILPQLIVGRSLKTESQAYEEIRKLFDLRNDLVHYKTKRKKTCDIKTEDWLWENDAELALRAVKHAVGALSELDPNVGIGWLEDAETNPYA